MTNRTRPFRHTGFTLVEMMVSLAVASIVLTDRGMTDDKLICCTGQPSARELRRVERFFHLYAYCKAWLNWHRGRPGRNACDGWDDASAAIARATPRGPDWEAPGVSF